MLENNNLKLYLVEYKELTLDIMESLNGRGYITGLLLRRENILEKVKSLDIEEDIIKELCKELKLQELEDEMQLAIKKEKVRIKTKIANLKKMKNANMKYTSSMMNYNSYNRINKIK